MPDNKTKLFLCNIFYYFFLLFISLLLFFPSACQYENLEVIKVPERIAIFFYCMHRWVFFRYVQCLYTGMGQKRAPYRNGFIYNQVKGGCYICLGSHAQGKQTYSLFSETSFEGNNPGSTLYNNIIILLCLFSIKGECDQKADANSTWLMISNCNYSCKRFVHTIPYRAMVLMPFSSSIQMYRERGFKRYCS